MPVWLEVLIALLSFLGLSGALGPWLVKRFRVGGQTELERALAPTFAKVDDLNRLRQAVDAQMKELDHRVQGVVTVAQAAANNADNALDAVREMKIMFDGHQRRMAEDVVEPMRAMAESLKRTEINQATTAAILERLVTEFDSERRDSRRGSER